MQQCLSPALASLDNATTKQLWDWGKPRALLLGTQRESVGGLMVLIADTRQRSCPALTELLEVTRTDLGSGWGAPGYSCGART